MTSRFPYYDPEDYQLLAMISQTVEKNRHSQSRVMSKLSPNGIIELSEPIELRMASAVLRLLDTLEQGKADERLWALAALHDEVLVMSRTFLRINTGRVLVQIMKELVRAKGDFETQLRLATMMSSTTLTNRIPYKFILKNLSKIKKGVIYYVQ